MSDLATTYFDSAIALLQRLRDEEVEPIKETAGVIGEALRNGSRLFAFGCSHSSLPVQDIVYRAGGLMLVNPLFGPGIAALDTRPTTLGSDIEKLPGYAKALLDNSPLREGDVLIVVSVSGRNAVPIELAQLAAERGITVVAVTSHEYTDAVESRHESGKKMKDFAHFVLDNKVAAGDAALELPQVPQRFSALSGVTSTALLHALVSEVIADLVDHDVVPPIFLAANLDGGAEWNAQHLSENAERIFYL
ncbi:SIS domain-containing protein [uncultured Aeromicrobium sp.]|uniref:SIS domain-containing protein n=1 Tax=uncultured Aeromicrobium sp. TaxID=337820 RepID=UPI0025FBAA72|nr:SIS domain-containing protein [uncultured Aeromicrobium sp.]